MAKEASLADIAARMGFREIPESLAAAEVPLDRGHHVAVCAARGAGEDAIYALALARSCDPADGAQALILVPTRDRALEVALSVQRAVGALGIRVSAPPLRADGSVDAGAADAHCVVERPSQLLPEVRLGRLGLGNLRLLVIDGLADLVDVEEWSSAAPLLDTLPADARRVVVSRRVDGAFRELMRHHLQRARRWPEELFRDPDAKPGGGGDRPAEGDGPRRVNVRQAPTEAARLALLLETIRGLTEPSAVRVACRLETSVPRVVAVLQSAGLQVTVGDGEWDVTAVPAGPEGEALEAGSGQAALIWFGLPLQVQRLVAQDDGSVRVVIVDVAHRSQLELMASRAGVELHLLPDPMPAAELDPLSRYRGVVRARIEKGGTDAELLVLEPLLREFGGTRVAAAVSDMLRESTAADPGVRPWADVEAATRGSDRDAGHRVERAARREHRGVRGAWSRMYVGAGKRDDVRAADLVGAITGETGIAGAQIGKIEIRGSFSLIEIDSQVVDDVIRKLDGTTIRGRAVTVRQDRES